MKILELTFGVQKDERAVAMTVDLQDLTVVVESPLDPVLAARAVRETLASAFRSTRDALPFVRISAEASGDALELSIADDAAGVRMLTEGKKGAIPLVLEVEDGSDEATDAALEALLLRVAIAAGATDSDQLFLAMAAQTMEAESTEVKSEVSDEERAYVKAHRHAVALADQVRAIDDRMTESVVPDWLWIATGFGGVGVLMTAIVLLKPELRIYMIPAVLVLSVLGFGLYGLRSLKELKLRGQLQIERAALRERRERARAKAREKAEALRKNGLLPEALIASALPGPSSGVEALSAPLILAYSEFKGLKAPDDLGRQVILFARPGDPIEPTFEGRIRPLRVLQ